ncbi:hypothetical protein ACWAT4_13035 [Bradyrhizobium manausense]
MSSDLEHAMIALVRRFSLPFEVKDDADALETLAIVSGAGLLASLLLLLNGVDLGAGFL